MDIDARLNEAIDKAYEDDEAAKTYISGKAIGAGSIGGKCAREIVMKFRWFNRSATFPGRLLRLFDRGHREEAVFIKHLEQVGAKVSDVDPSTGKQYRIKFAGGHGTGFLDGIATNLAEWLLGLDQDEPILTEFKTYNDKRFKDLKAKGIQETDPKYWAQPILYMEAYDLNYCLFCAVNKNTDELYFEVIEADDKLAESYRQRARMLAFNEVLPERIGNGKSSWYECKFCDFKSNCYTNKLPEVNCRTCAFGTVEEGQRFSCNHPQRPDAPVDISVEGQYKGCKGHAFHAAFIESTVLTYEPELNGEAHVAYRVTDTDTILFNGRRPAEEDHADALADELGGIVVESEWLAYTAQEISDKIG